MPLTGMPMLSAMVAISFGGMISRIAFWMRANSLAASSTRVPTGARACIRIWPESTAGKKFWPRNGTSENDASTKAMKPTMNGPRWRSAISRRSR